MEQDIDDILEADAIPTDSGDGQELWEHYRFVAEKGQNLLRVDKFLVSHIDNTSRNRIQQAAEANCILANGKAVKSNYRVKPGDIISLVMDRPRYELDIIPEDIPLDIVYEDDQLLVVNKPAGLVVHPGHGNYSGTLVNALAYHSATTPTTTSATRGSASCTASTKTHRDCLSLPKHQMPRLFSASNSSTRQPIANTWRWYGANSLKTTGLWKATSAAIRKTACKWLSSPKATRANTPSPTTRLSKTSAT